MQHVISELLRLNLATGKELMKVTRFDAKVIDKSLPRIIFPPLRNKSLRISEQEVKMIYSLKISEIEKYFYSIETPTQEFQTLKGAFTDLTIWQFNEHFQRVASIELKVGNPDIALIEKGLKNLMSEKIPGNWFHILKRTNNQKMTILLEKFCNSFKLIGGSLVEPIIFSFCILDLGICISKVLEPTHNLDERILNSFFFFQYVISKSGFFLIQDNGWSVTDLKLS